MTTPKAWFPSVQQLDEAFAKSGFARRPEYAGKGGHLYSRGETHLFVFSWSNPDLAASEGMAECRLVVDVATLVDSSDYRRAGSSDQITIDYDRDAWDEVVVSLLVKEIASTHGEVTS